MTATKHPFRRLSTAEALRALYIDFEGGKDQPPVLLGVHRRGRGARPPVYHVVVDEAFEGLADSCLSLRAAVENVVRRAERRDRRIVSWSEHDLEVVRTLRAEDEALVARFEGRYANARSVAERWRTVCHAGEKPEVGHLADYLTRVGYTVPDEGRSGQVGETIRNLRPRLERGLALTGAQRELWEHLVEHNRHDCIGMRRVCLRATKELEASADR